MSATSHPQTGPLLAADALPPGRFANGVWEGESEWRTRHGLAIVQWRFGARVYVWNALCPDGRADVATRAPASLTFRLAGDGALTHGTIELRADDVVFTPLADPLDMEVDDDQRTLFEHLSADPAFVNAVQAPAFASALYYVLENRTLNARGQRTAFGQRSAAHFVAALRANGEDYLDYAWGRGATFTEADVTAVNDHFARLGVAVMPEENA